MSTSDTWNVVPGDSHIRYGLYLRPSFEMAQAVASMHALMERQYGQTRAGKYMPHSTIGFFRSSSESGDLIAAVEPVVSSRKPFVVQNHGVIRSPGASIMLDIHHDDSVRPNEMLQSLHDDAHAALYPLTEQGDRFHWSGEGFAAHITLV